MRHAAALDALAGIAPLPPPPSGLARAKAFVAEFQHHDAITGTHEINVTHMYQEHLDAALQDAGDVVLEALERAGTPALAVTLASPSGPYPVGRAGAVILHNSLGWDSVPTVVTVLVPTRTTLARRTAAAAHMDAR